MLFPNSWFAWFNLVCFNTISPVCMFVSARWLSILSVKVISLCVLCGVDGEGGGGCKLPESGKDRVNKDFDCNVEFWQVSVDEIFCWFILIIFVSVGWMERVA